MHEPLIAEYRSREESSSWFNWNLRIVQSDLRATLEGRVFVIEAAVHTEIRGIAIWECSQHFADVTNNFLYSKN